MHRRIGIVGAPICDGEREFGVEKAPIAIRAAGLQNSLKSFVQDFGDIILETPIRGTLTGKLRNIKHIADGNTAVMREVAKIAADGSIPLILGGDRSLFHGSVCALMTVHPGIGAIYLDGHADFNTPETTSSGYFSGMALAASVGRCNALGIDYRLPSIREEDVCVVGARGSNIDPLELRNLKAAKVNLVTVNSLRREGFTTTLEKITGTLRKPLYLHFDLDVIDINDMPALAGKNAGVHSSGGVSYKEAVSLCRALGKLPLAAVDITLYDPKLDPTGECAGRIVELLTAVLS